MRRGGQLSWRITESPSRELNAALFLRDAAGLTVRSESAVPPLDPAVGPDAELGAFATEQSAADWQSWWTWLLAAEQEHSHRADPREWIRDGAPGADLRALIDAGLDTAYAWANTAKKVYLEDFRRRTRDEALIPTRVVGEVGRDLGREVEPFDLRVLVLAVTGMWGCLAQERLLLVSGQMRCDVAAYRPLLESTVRSLM